MANATHFSISVIVPAGDLPIEVTDRLNRLRTLGAEMKVLAAQGLCGVEVTSRDVTVERLVRSGVVGEALSDMGVRKPDIRKAAGKVMQLLFGSGLVQFYCVEFGHRRGVCECPSLLQGREAGRPVYIQLGYRGTVAAGWAMDRADLLKLSDEQVMAMPGLAAIKDNVQKFISWLRAHPEAH